MFDWIRYIHLAKILIERNDGESLRTAIGRLYYGFFGILRQYLIYVKNKYYLMDYDVDVHSKVYRELKASKDPTENQMANILNSLRFARNHADYDLGEEYDLNFFKEFLNRNDKDLIVAFDTVNYLKKHPNY